MVKNPPEMWETWIQSLGWEDPLEEVVATCSSVLAWRILMDRGAWWATVHRVQRVRPTRVAKHSTDHLSFRMYSQYKIRDSEYFYYLVHAASLTCYCFHRNLSSGVLKDTKEPLFLWWLARRRECYWELHPCFFLYLFYLLQYFCYQTAYNSPTEKGATSSGSLLSLF